MRALVEKPVTNRVNSGEEAARLGRPFSSVTELSSEEFSELVARRRAEEEARHPKPKTPVLDTIPWLEEALRRFPELVKEVERWMPPGSTLEHSLRETLENPYAVWNELMFLWKDAWKAEPPRMEFIDRMYAYCDWCLDQPRGETCHDDLFTATVVCFLEEIGDTPAALLDMPNRFTWEQVESSSIFAPIVGEELRAAYDAHRERTEKKDG